MKQFDFRKYWNDFLGWKGWTVTGAACVKVWRTVIRWKGWKRIFFLPMSGAALLLLLCCFALVWVFLKGMDWEVLAIGLYILSAYSLVALCVRFPASIRRKKSWMESHPETASFLKDEELHFKIKLYGQQIINFGYGLYKIAAGVVIGSAWIGCDGIYNMAQAFVQLFQILKRKKHGDILEQWRAYRSCGALVILLHLTLIGIVFQMVNWNRVEEQGEIMIIATAAFAFYKFISSFVDLAKDRKHKQPIDSSVRMLELSQAFFVIFSLQAGMLHTFGTGESWEHWINLAVGCIVCLLTVSMGIYMILRANREIKRLRENVYGT